MPHVLCYANDPWAYFTSKPLSEQTGSDWSRNSYEHNAGEPDADEPGQIVKVAWDGEFETPEQRHGNNYGTGLSVEQINQGACAWLIPARYGNAPKAARPIPAGTTLEEFRRLIRLGGGTVYEATGDR